MSYVFKSYHSTETALWKIMSNFRLNSDENIVSILIPIHISAAFDMIDHNILINHLEWLVGVSTGVVWCDNGEKFSRDFNLFKTVQLCY